MIKAERTERNMKLYGIDSSGLTASVAIMEDDIMVADYSVNYKKTHSQTLVPMLSEISKMTETDLSTIDAIAIAKGPGSFTGLRIGSATAKGLGLALDIPIAEIPTTDALAYNMYGTDRVVCPLMDARREQVYTGLYEFVKTEASDTGFEMNTILDACAIPVEDIVEQINKIGRPVILLGDGVPVYREKIDSLMKVDYVYAPASMSRQRAASVATLAYERIKAGKLSLIPASEHVPEYLRLSQAERERNEANGV